MDRPRGVASQTSGAIEMYWQDAQDDSRYVVPDDVVDIVYAISCRALPVDHAWALSQAVTAALPWLAEDARAGVHTIHVADSGNGWMRPDAPDDLLYLSRRTKLMLRVARECIDDAQRLTGRSLDVAGNRIEVGKGSVRPLTDITTIFARYVVTDGDKDESAFLAHTVAELRAMDVHPKKMLCGIERLIATPGGKIHTRSLMLADLRVEESVRLQQQGLGPRRNLGCGLFLPHKGIREVQEALV